jgi:hypothetical protein
MAENPALQRTRRRQPKRTFGRYSAAGHSTLANAGSSPRLVAHSLPVRPGRSGRKLRRRPTVPTATPTRPIRLSRPAWAAPRDEGHRGFAPTSTRRDRHLTVACYNPSGLGCADLLRECQGPGVARRPPTGAGVVGRRWRAPDVRRRYSSTSARRTRCNVDSHHPWLMFFTGQLPNLVH